MKRLSVFFAVIIIAGIFAITCDNSTEPSGPSAVDISLTFTGPQYQGNYYHGYLPKNDFVIWITDSDTNVIKNLLISNAVVKVLDNGPHEEHVPVWAASADETDSTLKEEILNSSYIPAKYDGITSASFSFSSTRVETTITVEWDLTNSAGETVADNVPYYFWAEVANIQKDTSYISPGVVDTTQTCTILSEATYGTVQLNNSTSTAATTTQHITGLTASFK